MNFFENFAKSDFWVMITKNFEGSGKYALLVEIIGIIAMWIIFSKADRFGIGSIIPIYRQIVLLQISGMSGWLVFLYLVPVVNLIVYVLLAYNLSRKFNRGILCTLGLIFIRPVALMYLAFGPCKYRG